MSIRAENLNYIYNEGSIYEVHAIRDVNFEISDGEFIAIIGHTGSGKSTLVQMLNGLLKIKSGSLVVGSYEVGNMTENISELRKKVGLVFQYPEYQLFEETVQEDVAFGPKNLGYEGDALEQAITRALEAVGLNSKDIREASPFELSGGQKRKVAIAGVLAMNPEVLMLDEPTSGLDPASRDEMLDLIKMEHEDRGRITIIISHDMREVARLADRIIVMSNGKIAMIGTPKEVYRDRQKLIDLGLDVPEITQTSHILNARGFDIDPGVFDVDEWVDIVAEQVKEMRKGSGN